MQRTTLFVSAILGLGLHLCLPEASKAEASNPPDMKDPYYAAALPLSGAYFDPANPGLSMIVDIRPDGSAFVLLGTYDANGTPTWYAMQDRFQPTPAYTPGTPVTPENYFPATIGTVSGPVYIAEGGSCMDCPPTYPNIELADLDGQPGPETGTLTWSSTSHVSVDIGNTHWSMIRLPLDGSPADRIQGAWQLIGSLSVLPEQDFNSRVRISPVAAPIIQVDPAADADTLHMFPPLPEHATHWFRVFCDTNCEATAVQGSPSQGLWEGHPGASRDPATTVIASYIWFDETTGKAGFEQFIAPNTPPPCSICYENKPVVASAYRYQFELHLTADGFSGRRSLLSHTSGSEGSALQLVRLRF